MSGAGDGAVRALSLRKDGRAAAGDRGRTAAVTPPFRRVLVANRGEIALRIIRACHELGMEAVAVYSDADAAAAHVRAADHAVRLGPPPAAESYLRLDAVVAAAVAAGARGRPSGLRLPVGAGGVRPRRRGGRPRLGRPARRRRSPRWVTSWRRGGRPAQAGVPHVPGTLEPASVDAPGPGRGGARGGPGGRVPAAREGRGRRRRARDAPRRLRRRAGRRRCSPAPARRPAPSATARSTWSARSCRRATSRSSCWATRRGRSSRSGSGTARCSGATRSSSRRRRPRASARPSVAGCTRWPSGWASAAGLRNAATVRVPLRPRRRVLVPRGEHAAPGRAPRDRAGRRPRHRRASSSTWLPGGPSRPGPWRRPSGRRARRATPSSSGSRPRTPPASSLRRPAGSRAGRCRPAPGSGVDTAVEAGDRVPSEYDPLIAKLIAHAEDRPAAIARLRRAVARRRSAASRPRCRSTGRCWRSRGSSTRPSLPPPGSTPTGTARARRAAAVRVAAAGRRPRGPRGRFAVRRDAAGRSTRRHQPASRAGDGSAPAWRTGGRALAVDRWPA